MSMPASIGSARRGTPTKAPPSGMAPACKGALVGTSPIRAIARGVVAPATKKVVSGTQHRFDRTDDDKINNHKPCPRATTPVGDCPLMAGCPYKGVLVVVSRPLTGGLVHSRHPLAAGLAVGGRPVGKPTAGRSYIPVFQIRMEKMKEVKHPPL
ncbi:hypothetical protein B296_00024020 [Ensete ventricosum]|uniref:Uncharacterized protein n=1 Tax=Ensete ventricosum TaxID=4639 RepID=A0A427A403_ENSVE|nr:hypothetical protein B296_00024020 [Ensete ventricosum]